MKVETETKTAMGDPCCGCCLSPYGYSLVLKKLMTFVEEKIVLALEGGYNLYSLPNSVLACVKTLKEANQTWRIINEVGIKSSSDSDAEDHETSHSIYTLANNNVEDAILSCSKLNVDNEDNGKFAHLRVLISQKNVQNSKKLATETYNQVGSWRSSLSKVDVWYGCYGSNMWRPRFLCYIEGGKVEGLLEPCPGARDKSLPKDIRWKSIPHRLFFGRSYTKNWGYGGVAFLNPQSSIIDKAYMCMYRITLEQFNDVLVQENSRYEDIGSNLVDCSDIELLEKIKFMTVESLKGGWYSDILYLGELDGIPILTMTCPLSDVEKYKSEELPVCPPAKGYENTLLKGLVEGKQLSMEDAIAYVNQAATAKI